MQPAQFFSSANVLIVAGKGGVGKTVAAATIATSAARSGLSVLLVEVSGRSSSAPMFGAESQGYEEVTAVHEAGPDGSGSVTLKSITPDQALVASIRGGAAALVGVQAHLNRMGARTLDPPPRSVSALRLSVGPTHFSLSGAF